MAPFYLLNTDTASIHTHIHACTYAHTNTHTCTHTLTYMNTHTHTHTCMHTHIPTQMHIHSHTYTHIHTHTKPTPSISTRQLAAIQRKLRDKQTSQSLRCHSWVCSQSSNVHNSFNGTNLNLWLHQFSQRHGLSVFPGNSLQGVDRSVVAAPGQVVTGTLRQPLKTGEKNSTNSAGTFWEPL